MTDARRFRLPDLIPFVLVLFAAAGARVGYVLNYADNAATDGPILVQDAPPTLALADGTTMRGQSRVTEADALIHNMKEHRWFGSLAPFAYREERTAHVAPGYPWLRGELERFLPEDLGAADRLIRWLQCVLGTLTAGLYYLVARRAFPGRTVAVLTGLLCALHPFWIVNTPALSDGVLATFLLALCLWLGVRASQVEGAGGSAFAFGLALAALVLVRAALLPFAIVAVLWLLRRTRAVAGGWQFGMVAVLGLLLGLAPWTVRNIQVFGDVFPIVDSTYLHVWIGNNPRATGGPLADVDREAALSPELAKQLASPMITQPARYRLFGAEVVREIQNNPAGTVERRLWAGLYFFFGADWFNSKQLWRPAEGASAADGGGPYPGLLIGSLFLMVLLGVLGWRWTYVWRKEAGLLALAVMWIPLPYILTHAEALSGPRLPLDGVLLCLSAFALACAAPPVAKKLLRPKRAES